MKQSRADHLAVCSVFGSLIAGVLLASLLTVIASCSADGEDPLTAEERAWLNEHDGKILLIPYSSYPPIDFLDKDGVQKGLATDIMLAIEERLDFRVQRVHVDSWDEMLVALKNRNADIIGSIQNTPERREYLRFTEPYVTIPSVIIVKKDAEGPLTLHMMSGMRVAIVEGFASNEFVKSTNPEIDIVPVKDTREGLEMVSFGAVDASIAEIAVASYYIDNRGISNLKTAGDIGYDWNLCLASRKDLPILNRILEKGLSLVTEDERERICDKWISLEMKPFYQTREFWYTLSALLSAILVAIVGILLWNRALKREVGRKTFELQESEEKFRSLVESSSDYIWEVNRDGVFTYASPQVESMLGYRPEEVVGQTPFDLMPPGEAARGVRSFNSVVETGNPIVAEENVHLHKDGRRVILETSGVAFFDGEGKVLGYRGVDRDISERKRAEDGLAESHALFQGVIEQSPIPMVIARPTGEMTYNKACAEQLRFIDEPSIKQGVNLFEMKRPWKEYGTDGKMIPVEDLPLALALQGTTTTGREIRVVRKDGSEKWEMVNAAPIYNNDGQLIAAFAAFPDITERKHAEIDVFQSREFLDSVIHGIADPVFVKDGEHRWIVLNDALCRLVGRSHDEMLGKTDHDLFPKEQADVFWDHDNMVMASDEVDINEEEITGAEGTRTISTIKSSFTNPVSGERFLVGTIRDITERKRAEGALRESEETYRMVADKTGQLVYDYDIATGRIQWLGDIVGLTGFTAEEFEGIDINAWERMMHPDDREAILTELSRATSEKTRFRTEYRFSCRDGSYIHIESNGGFLVDDSGKAYRMLGTMKDITERKQAEEELRLRMFMIESGSGVLATCDLEGSMTYVNPAFLAVWGFDSGSEIYGRPFAEFWMVDHIIDEVMSSLRGDGTWTGEIQARRKDGALFTVQVQAAMVRDGKGDPIGLMSSSIDVTERKNVEERFRLAAQSSSDMIYEWNLSNDTLLWFGDIDRALGCAPGEEPGTIEAWFACIHPDDIVRLGDAVERHRVSTEDISCEYRVRRKDGSWRYWVDHGIPVVNEAGLPSKWVGTCTDITDRRESEDEVRHLRNYLSNIINSMPSVLVGVDKQGTVTQWNREAYRSTGMPSEDAVGQPLDRAFPSLASETVRVRKAMQSRRTLSSAKQARQEDGETRYEDVTIYPLVANGVEGAVIRVDDVTERVRLEEMMIQSEKMLSVGGLAAGMAHEINNPLAGMMQTANVMSNRLGNLELPANQRAAEEAGTTVEAIRNFVESREIPRMIAVIGESGQRVAGIVENMLSFARKSDTRASSHDITELIDRTLELAATDYDLKKHYDFKSIAINKQFEDNLPSVPCERAKIQQVLLNLLRNGAQAMDVAGTVQPQFTVRARHDKERNMVVIDLEDNGPGMDDEVRKRVFEPFYTTKPAGVGTGLGLSVSYFIITENHNGELIVKSQPGSGSTFIMRLPVERGNT